jgi:hypothetical protein
LLSEPHQWEHEQNCQNADKYLFWFHDVYCLLNQDFHFGIVSAKHYTPKSMISIMRTSGKNIFQGKLTIGLDLGDRSSAYCVLNAAGEIVLEHTFQAFGNSEKPPRNNGLRGALAVE